MLSAPEQSAPVLSLPYAIPSTALSSYLSLLRLLVAAKKLRPGPLDPVLTTLLALASKQLLLPAAVPPPVLARVLARVPPAVLGRTEPAALQALVRADPLPVLVQALVLVQVQGAVVHLK